VAVAVADVADDDTVGEAEGGAEYAIVGGREQRNTTILAALSLAAKRRRCGQRCCGSLIAMMDT